VRLIKTQINKQSRRISDFLVLKQLAHVFTAALRMTKLPDNLTWCHPYQILTDSCKGVCS